MKRNETEWAFYSVLLQNARKRPKINKKSPQSTDFWWFESFSILAEMERFELSRRYSRPTPLAGAPLHHLSTTPNQWYKIVRKTDFRRGLP